ncbi:MAG TPA: hypothetical protein VFH56_13890 [Acidimicrobiales bacterium]|nr:hypothetical protein [Acidimicrobiales bacterium]
MASVSAIRAQIASDLTGISALTSAFPDGYRVSAYPVSNPTPPQLEIAQFGIQKHQSMTGGSTAEWWTVIVRAYLAVTSDSESLKIADSFLASDPVTAAIEADRTLNGQVSDLIVDRADQRFWDHPQLRSVLAGVEWQLRILL